MQKSGATIIIIAYAICLIFAITCTGKALSYPLRYTDTINTVCAKFDIAPTTMCALINTESSFNPDAKSSAGALGLTQLLPSTAEYICVKNGLEYTNFNLFNPSHNIYLGAMYLRYLLNKFSNTYTALCAYNAGETIVREWLNNPKYSHDTITLYSIPYEETNNYIVKIKTAEKVYSKFYHLS